MSVNKYLEKLSEPFGADCVKWRLQNLNKEKTEGYAVAYLDSRAIAQRLDDVVGQMRWKDEYKPWMPSKDNRSQLCTIYIFDDELKEWVSKSDGAEMSEIQPIKGGISDAFKRAAVKWGIGRYLYSMKPVWVKAKRQGKSMVVDGSELPRLQQTYLTFLKNIDGPGETSAKKPPAQKTPESKKSNIAPMYEILGVKKQQNNNIVRSLLRIKDLKSEDKVATVYYNGEDSNLKVGAKLGRAVFSSKDTDFGKVHILQDYDLAA
jgi:hypothetical protein